MGGRNCKFKRIIGKNPAGPGKEHCAKLDKTLTSLSAACGKTVLRTKMGHPQLKPEEEKDVENVNATSVSIHTGIDNTLLYMIPPEIWEQIFEYLFDGSDCASLSNVLPYWEKILNSTRSSWLFGFIFPSILEHLTRNDILLCRLVCKRWQIGINKFLTNNAHHRPHLTFHWKDSTPLTFNTDIPLVPLERKLYLRGLLYNDFSSRVTINQFLDGELKCPFLGRSAYIVGFLVQIVPPESMRFAVTFGKHISFLKLHVDIFHGVEFLRNICILLQHFVNLKKLYINGKVNSNSGMFWKKDNQVQDLELYMGNIVSVKKSDVLPKLETLHLRLRKANTPKMTEVVLIMLGSESLRSLDLYEMPSYVNWNTLKNLVDLSVRVKEKKHVVSLLKLNAPLRKLSLCITGRVEASTLFSVVRKFQDCLRHLCLELTLDYFYASTTPKMTLPFQLASFLNVNALNGFRYLKRVSLCLRFPVSLNFLIGLRDSLEYLSIDILETDDWTQFLKCSFVDQELHEKMNLLKYMNKLNAFNKLSIYKSNAWTFFPKLRVLTLKGCDFGQRVYHEGWEYRRDTYDKFVQKWAQCSKKQF